MAVLMKRCGLYSFWGAKEREGVTGRGVLDLRWVVNRVAADKSFAEKVAGVY
jgi:hypothetical protein